MTTTPRRLIEYASCGGCAGKIPVGTIAGIVERLPKFEDPNLIVGADHFSDAGVYRLRDDLAIVNTCDFFPPLVDDPYTFGQIAATNALSDVYAMGAEPKTALNIVAFPDESAEPRVLQEILAGAAERVLAADAVVVGGHSLRDSEIKFGLAVTGVVDPARMLTNAGAQPGDTVVLTKALGTGLAVGAFRKDACPPETYDAAVASMTTLNRAARDAALASNAHGATDVTGFGLGGHAGEMADASGVTMVLSLRRLPRLHGVESLARAGHQSRATESNRRFVEPRMAVEGDVDDLDLSLLFDAQTSGGLLISVPSADADALVDRCRASGLTSAAIVGTVRERRDATIVVEP